MDITEELRRSAAQIRDGYGEEVDAAVELMFEAAEMIEHLRALPCNSMKGNQWLNENAPEHVLDSLWAWRRMADKALKAAESLSQVIKLAKELTPTPAEGAGREGE